jgi:integrase/recombinase XerD
LGSSPRPRDSRLAAVPPASKPDGQVPRVHDARHSFAVNALLRWYRAGIDITARLPYLATYMGHVSVVSTERYIHLVEELGTHAGERFERRCGSVIAPDVIPAEER